MHVRFSIYSIIAGIWIAGCAEPAPPPKVESDTKTESAPRATPESAPAATPEPARSKKFRPLDLSFISDNFVAAAVIHPNRFLTGPLVSELFDSETAIQNQWEVFTRDFKPDPKFIDELVVLFDRDSFQIPPRLGFEDPASMPGLIVRMKPDAPQFFAPRALAFKDDPKLEFHDDTHYIHDARTARHSPTITSYVQSSEETLKKMLSAKAVKSPLVNELSKRNRQDDLIVVVDISAIEDKLRSLADGSPIEPNAQVQSTIDQLLNAETLTVTANLTDQPTVRVEIRGKDRQTVVAIRESLVSLLAFAKTALKKLPSDDKRAGTVWKPLADELLKNHKLEVSKNELVLETRISPANLEKRMLPIRELARERDRRRIELNKLLNISIAIMNFSSYFAEEPLPARAIVDSRGQPLLSWRVAILPYIDQAELYRKFHLDEPWDSPHNSALLKEMPDVFRFPDDAESQVGSTRVLAVVGEDAAFAPKVDPPPEDEELSKGCPMSEFKDGKAGTLMLVLAGKDKAVPWTKPADFSADSSDLFEELGTIEDDVIWAVMGDGSPHQLPANIKRDALRSLITISGSDRIDPSVASRDSEFLKIIKQHNERIRSQEDSP